MPNIQSILKSEIARVTRKELKSDTATLKKSSAAYRSDIAALKRRLAALEAQIKKLGRATSKAAPQDAANAVGLRFRAAGFAKNRQRLGLSATETALLIGASSLSVYKWEKGEGTPRRVYLPAIAALRSMGKKEVQAKLAELKP